MIKFNYLLSNNLSNLSNFSNILKFLSENI